MEVETPKYYKARSVRRLFRMNACLSLQNFLEKWRAFLSILLVIMIISISSKVSNYKKLWNSDLITGEFSNIGSLKSKKLSFWEKTSFVSKVSSCLNTCPLPPSIMLLSESVILKGGKSSIPSCPTWFQYIHDDLSIWKGIGGISRHNLEAAKPMASFHVVISNGRLFVEHFSKCPESREFFTLWGISQLLRKFPGKIPDLEFMFDCSNKASLIQWTKANRNRQNASGDHMPVLFRYTGGENSAELVFPDWSFWGWSEVNLASWDRASWHIMNRTGRQPWRLRKEVAHWKGFREVSEGDPLEACNAEKWRKTEVEILGGENPSEAPLHDSLQLQDQPYAYRFKIFPGDGRDWAVSLKYFLAIGSVTLLPPLPRHTFYSRGLIPTVHYWPIDTKHVCDSIHFAVEYGNLHINESIRIARATQAFVQNEINIDRVYDYMFYLLNGYAELMKFDVKVPTTAHEVCLDSILCLASPAQMKILKPQKPGKITFSHIPCQFKGQQRKSWEEFKLLKSKKQSVISKCEDLGWKSASQCNQYENVS